MDTAKTMSQQEAYQVMFLNYPDVLDINTLSEILSISTNTAYKLLRSGAIQSLKVGRAFRIPKAHVLTYLGIINAEGDLS